jgi:hypothetical protein
LFKIGVVALELMEEPFAAAPMDDDETAGFEFALTDSGSVDPNGFTARFGLARRVVVLVIVGAR